MSFFQKLCIGIFMGLGVIVMEEYLPLPSSTPGKPMSIFRSFAFIGYSMLFCIIGGLVGGGIEHGVKSVHQMIMKKK